MTLEAREGAIADLTATRAARFLVTARIEWATAPADNESLDVYMGVSLSGIAGTANPGELTGADADYTGSTGSSLAESLLQLDFVGSLMATNDATALVQQQSWIYSPGSRYVIPVAVNNTSDTLMSDAVEMSITMTPLVDEVQ